MRPSAWRSSVPPTRRRRVFSRSCSHRIACTSRRTRRKRRRSSAFAPSTASTRTREAQEQAERTRQKLQQDLTAAQSQVTSAADFIGTRRGAVGAEARTRLSEAQRHLQAAQQLASTDTAQALQHAQAATQLGAKALWAAQSDVRQWEQRQQPRSYLYFGVTQLLDLASRPERLTTFEAQPQHPDLFHCGPAIVMGGYPGTVLDERTRKALLPMTVFEPANAAAHPLPAGEDPAQHTPEAVIARIAAEGGRCVKIFIENGFGERERRRILAVPAHRLRAERR